MIRFADVLTPTAAFLLVIAGGACQTHEFPPPDRDQRVAAADTMFAELDFDSISWESDSARAFDGNNVYAATCRRCHGTLGAGATEYARNRNLDVPSLIEPDWRFDGDVAAIRHNVFVGHSSGMPTFGVGTLKLREIDAAAWYVVHVLRPEALRADPIR